MLLPGPEAQQLATYIGWLMHRTWGGIIAGALFVLPSLAILIALSWVYIAFGDVPWVAGLFFGIKPAVTAIVVSAAVRTEEKVLPSRLVPVAVSLPCDVPFTVRCALPAGWAAFLGGDVEQLLLRRVAGEEGGGACHQQKTEAVVHQLASGPSSSMACSTPRKRHSISTTKPWSSRCGTPETVTTPTTPVPFRWIGKPPPALA